MVCTLAPVGSQEEVTKMGSVVELDDNNFEAEVTQSKGVVLVDFGAEWCGPCQRLAPIIEEIATEYAGKAKVARVEIDNARKSATAFAIMSVPTVIVFKDGKEISRNVGLIPKQNLASLLDSALA